MKTNIQKTVVSLLLITALCISGISYQPKAAKAADTAYTSLFSISNESDVDPLPAGETVTHNFNVTANGDIDIILQSTFATSVHLIIASSTGTELYNKTLELSQYNSNLYAYVNGVSWSSPTLGSYTISMTFTDNTYYAADAIQYPSTQATTQPTQPPIQTPTPSLSESQITVTAGFSQTISAYNAGGGVTWSSGNNSVATVKNGKITGKKPGTTTISAKTAAGYTMTCKVTVKKNEYSVKKASVSDLRYGTSGLDIYKVSYDKKGNLVIKARLLNNNSYQLKMLKNMKIKIKTNNGKLIGQYSVKKLNNVNLNAGKAKKYTFKIKKSKLKSKKKADLRLITTNVSGKAWYIQR